MKTMAHGEMTSVGGVTNTAIQVQGCYTAACDAIGNGSQTADQAFATVNPKIQGLFDAWWRAHPNG